MGESSGRLGSVVGRVTRARVFGSVPPTNRVCPLLRGVDGLPPLWAAEPLVDVGLAGPLNVPLLLLFASDRTDSSRPEPVRGELLWAAEAEAEAAELFEICCTLPSGAAYRADSGEVGCDCCWPCGLGGAFVWWVVGWLLLGCNWCGGCAIRC